MSSAKKGKKTKGKQLSLGEFLGVTNSAESAVIVSTKASWADETEDFDDRYCGPSEKIVLPKEPRQARGPNIDPDRIPDSPPFLAHVANLPFEVEEEDILLFFGNLEVEKINLPREAGEFGRFKGFGYVEFKTRSDLLNALALNEEMLYHRKIRVDIAEDERGSGRRDRDGPQRRDDDREDRSGGVSDWRAAPRDAGSERSPVRERNRDRSYGERDRGGYSDRDRGGYSDRDRGGYSDRDRGYNDRERGYNDRDRGYGDRDRGYGDRDRGYNDRDRNYGGRDNRGYNRGSGDRDRYDRDYDRGRYGGGGGGRYEDRRGGGGGGGGGSYGRRDDDRWRTRGEGTRDDSRDNENPKERPKLNLKPRTKAIEVAKEEDPPAANPSIFGAARPVNTAQRELEIEKKLVKSEPKEAAPKKEPPVVSAKDIFGNAKPVDTAAREREIEEKLKKQDPVRREEKETKPEVKRSPIKLEKRPKDKVEETKHKEQEERQNDKNVLLSEIETSEKEIKHATNEESKNTKSEKGNKSKKGKKSKDKKLIINTTNKFCAMGLEEEEA